jgi:hypothetical protein
MRYEGAIADFDAMDLKLIIQNFSLLRKTSVMGFRKSKEPERSKSKLYHINLFLLTPSR